MHFMEEVEQRYAEFVASRRKPLYNQVQDILHGAVGISGEAGELLDSIKKSWIYNKPLDTKNIREELGDLFFYARMICNDIDCSFRELIEENMDKLTKRYPNGYTDRAAIERADKNETAPSNNNS